MRHSDLRLALFSDTYVPQMNGVARTLARLVDALSDRGGTVRVFTPTDPSATESADIVRCPSVKCPVYSDLRLGWAPSADVMAELRRFQPSVVHLATPFGVGLAGRGAARALGLPLVTSYHTSFAAYTSFYGLGVLEQPSWQYLRWFHNAGRRTYCPTSVIGSVLAARGFERLAVWGRGVDRALFTQRKRSRAMRSRVGASDADIVVAYVGRMAQEKGLNDLLAAARRSSNARSRVIYAFVGDGPYLDPCRASAPENCFFLGRLDGEELATFYASADLFAFPSITDTFGNVLLEAMASGLPLIVADAAATREVVDGAAEYYDGGNGVELARIIEAMARDPHRRHELAAASRMRAARYTWDVVFDELFASYEQVARGESLETEPRIAA